MKLLFTITRILFCGVLISTLLFCNRRQDVQRGPEQDSLDNPIEADNTVNADTLNRVDTTQTDTTRKDPNGKP